MPCSVGAFVQFAMDSIIPETDDGRLLNDALIWHNIAAGGGRTERDDTDPAHHMTAI